jgi:uncharacterized protein YqeY
MLEQISNDIKVAMKEKNKAKLDALRYLKAMLIENKTAPKPRPELDVVVQQHKKLKDSLESYPAGHEMVAKIKTEIEFVSAYLPKAMEEAEVQALIDQIKSSMDNPHMGMIMKELTPQIKGRFDGKKASEMVKASLA